LRASRPATPNVITRESSEAGYKTLECAAVMSASPSMAEKEYTPEQCEAVDKAGFRNIGLGEMLVHAARSNGWSGRSARNDIRGVLRAAFAPDIQAAGFSTVAISDTLSNVANKFLLAGFSAVEQSWRKIAATRTVQDFKTITSYRLTGDQVYEKVGPGGEIQHGKLADESFTNKADTYARMYGITRTDIINDDLGALTDIPRRLGRSAALTLNHHFWTEFMDHSSFFTSGNKNTMSTALSSAGLTAGVLLFRDQTDADGFPLALQPAVLLVPPNLEVTAQELFVSTNLNSGGSSTTAKIPNVNVHAAKYEPVVSAYLNNSSYTGYSITAWYLLANPADLAAIEVVFLNGVETPTVESADADFNTLGIQMRGYHDFGVSKQEPRAAIKSTGA